MRGGGRGGGGRQPYAAPDGADVAAIPPASRKMVQSLKGILADRSEAEIYATLCDCGMDPDIAVERLISQGMLEPSLAFRSPRGSNCLARILWRRARQHTLGFDSYVVIASCANNSLFMLAYCNPHNWAVSIESRGNLR